MGNTVRRVIRDIQKEHLEEIVAEVRRALKFLVGPSRTLELEGDVQEHKTTESLQAIDINELFEDE